MTYCSVVTVLALISLTKAHFRHYAILKILVSDHQVICHSNDLCSGLCKSFGIDDYADDGGLE